MAEQKLVVWLLVFAVAVLLLNSFVIFGNNGLSEEDVERVVADGLAGLPVPASAAEIALLVEVPEVVIPEWEVPESADNALLNDFLKAEYSDEFDAIEGAAEDDFFDEIQDSGEDELEDEFEGLHAFLLANIDGFKELTDVDEEEVDVTVKQLGLDFEDDKSAEVVVEFLVEYTIIDAPTSDRWEKTVLVSGLVSYDEGDFDDEDVSEVVYAFA